MGAIRSIDQRYPSEASADWFQVFLSLWPLALCGLAAFRDSPTAVSKLSNRFSGNENFAFRQVAESITLSTRRSHAASKSTPGMSGRVSKPFGDNEEFTECRCKYY